MSFLCIGDIHITLENTKEVNLLLNGIIVLIKEHNPDFIVIMGDILNFHEKIHTLALNHALHFIETINKLSRNNLYIIVGNHDMISGTEFLNENHWLNSLKKWHNIVIVDKPTELNYKNSKFIFMPYVEAGKFKLALNTLENWQTASCIFAHQEFKGCQMGGIISEHGDVWEPNLPNVVSGHIHKKQRLSENIYYTGSSIQTAFGESESNIIPLIKFESNNTCNPPKLIIQEFDLNLPRKKILYKSINDLEKLDINKDDKVKLCISSDIEEFKTLKKTKKYKDLIEQGVKIIHKPIQNPDETRENIEMKDSKDFTSVLSSLVNQNKNKFIKDIYKKIYM